jgi:MFS family permease
MTEGPTIRPPAQRAVAFGALRHRNFRLFFAGMVVSLIGMWMHRVAQSWLVLELTDSPFYVGLVDSLSYLPVLLFSLYAGALADRVSKRRVVMATQSGAMVLAFALAAFVFTDTVTIWHIMVVAGGIGIALAFDIPARQAFIVEMVGKEDLTNAIALNSSAFNGTRVIGPAIAGALIAAVGIGACFLVNGVTYIPMIAALALIRLPEHRPSAERKSTWSTIREGFRYVMSDRRIRVVMVNIAMLSVFGLPVLVLLPVVIRDELGLGAVEFGWTMSAVGIGALTGALALAGFGHRLPRGRVLAYSSLPVRAVALVRRDALAARSHRPLLRHHYRAQQHAAADDRPGRVEGPGDLVLRLCLRGVRAVRGAGRGSDRGAVRDYAGAGPGRFGEYGSSVAGSDALSGFARDPLAG